MASNLKAAPHWNLRASRPVAEAKEMQGAPMS
jgi:hypothetical protein